MIQVGLVKILVPLSQSADFRSIICVCVCVCVQNVIHDACVKGHKYNYSGSDLDEGLEGTVYSCGNPSDMGMCCDMCPMLQKQLIN